MFTQLFPPEVFANQAEFIRVMNANKDFVWWAESLITEETKELKQADEQNEGMEQIFKESADLLYVVAGFFNVLPSTPHNLIDKETNNRLQNIHDEALKTMSDISMKYQITPELFIEAFNVVHASNMSKLDSEGKPIRREDGKILKGPNYIPPDMSGVVENWKKVQKRIKTTETLGNAQKSNG